MLGHLHKGLEGKLSKEKHRIVGLPSRTPAETVAAIEAIRVEMAVIGRWLAEKHSFAYPHELETTVLTVWEKHKESVIQR